jgi:hypothetical protein
MNNGSNRPKMSSLTPLFLKRLKHFRTLILDGKTERSTDRRDRVANERISE